MWYLFLVSVICSLSWYWPLPAAETEYMGWNQPTSIFDFIYLCCWLFSFYMLCWSEPCIYAFPVLVWETFSLFQWTWRTIWSTQWWCSQLIHSNDIAVHLTQRPPSGAICVEIQSALFAAAVVSPTLHYFMSFRAYSPSLSLLSLPLPFIGQSQHFTSRLISK